MDRRKSIKVLASMGASFAIPCWPRSVAAIGMTTNNVSNVAAFNYREKRLDARFRTRRVIMNNDGNDIVIRESGLVTETQFLMKRTLGLAHTQVDSIFYCDGVNNIYSHSSDLTELPTDSSSLNLIEQFKAKGTDPLNVIIDFCKKNDKEVFWSMRMNDNHDSTRPELLSQYKKDNPQYLVGTKGVNMPMMKNKWAAFDYGEEAVRKLAVDTFRDVITRYDVNGIEIDFLRHSAFFKKQFYKEHISQEDCNLLTQMVRDIRAICDENSILKEKAILIAVRVPDSLGFSRSIGLDVEQWLKEDLVDLIITCDYLKFEPWENMVSLGKQYNVPVYACLEERRMYAEEFPETDNETAKKIWRGEAYMAWKAGISGIYTFNLFDPNSPLFSELGDMETLKTYPMRKQVSYINTSNYFDPDYWVVGGSRFLKNRANHITDVVVEDAALLSGYCCVNGNATTTGVIDLILPSMVDLRNMSVEMLCKNGVSLISTIPKDFSNYNDSPIITVKQNKNFINYVAKMKKVTPGSLPMTLAFGPQLRPSEWNHDDDVYKGWATSLLSETGNGTPEFTGNGQCLLIALEDSPKMMSYKMFFSKEKWNANNIFDIESSYDGVYWKKLIQYDDRITMPISIDSDNKKTHSLVLDSSTKYIRFVSSYLEEGSVYLHDIYVSKDESNNLSTIEKLRCSVYWKREELYIKSLLTD